MAKVALKLAILLVGLPAFANPYSCEIVEFGGEFRQTVEFNRNLIVNTELVGYTIEFSDYLGVVKITVTEKSNGAKVEEAEAASDLRAVGKQVAEFEGLVLEIPDVLTITCQSLSSKPE